MIETSELFNKSRLLPNMINIIKEYIFYNIIDETKSIDFIFCGGLDMVVGESKYLFVKSV